MMSGAKAPDLINSFFFLNLLILSGLVRICDVELACVGCGLDALGVVLATWVLLACSVARFLLFNFQKYSFFLSLWLS